MIEKRVAETKVPYEGVHHRNTTMEASSKIPISLAVGLVEPGLCFGLHIVC